MSLQKKSCKINLNYLEVMLNDKKNLCERAEAEIQKIKSIKPPISEYVNQKRKRLENTLEEIKLQIATIENAIIACKHFLQSQKKVSDTLNSEEKQIVMANIEASKTNMQQALKKVQEVLKQEINNPLIQSLNNEYSEERKKYILEQVRSINKNINGELEINSLIELLGYDNIERLLPKIIDKLYAYISINKNIDGELEINSLIELLGCDNIETLSPEIIDELYDYISFENRDITSSSIIQEIRKFICININYFEPIADDIQDRLIAFISNNTGENKIFPPIYSNDDIREAFKKNTRGTNTPRILQLSSLMEKLQKEMSWLDKKKDIFQETIQPASIENATKNITLDEFLEAEELLCQKGIDEKKSLETGKE